MIKLIIRMTITTIRSTATMDSMGVTTMNNKEEAVEVCTVVELPENTL